ncbi:MAG: EamA family transporter [Candidatus Aenigmarchaeota archaeon]|nr:EamA family transporter [Candidatus Aenigmarchaeota archaeon]
MELSSGIIFGLISMLGFGLSSSLSPIPAKRLGVMNAVFFRGIFMCLIFILLLPFFLSGTTFSSKYILIALAISVLAFIPLSTFLKALSIGKLGIISPIANSSIIFTVLFSILFFNESLNTVQFGSILLILLGIILISINFKDIKNSHIFKMSSGIPYALLTCVLWGLMFSLYKIPVMVIGPILTALIIEIGIFIISLIQILKTGKKINMPDRSTLNYLILLSIFTAIGGAFFNFGIMVAEVSIVAAISMANPLIATIYGKYVYKETISIQQYLAISFILIGIVALSFF